MTGLFGGIYEKSKLNDNDDKYYERRFDDVTAV